MTQLQEHPIAYAYSSRLWALMPNVCKVISELSSHDREFFGEVGTILKLAGQTHRFAITLLHSHVDIGENEFLADEITNVILTSVYRQDSASALAQLVPKSWKFQESSGTAFETEWQALTYIQRKDLDHEPLGSSDAPLMRNLAAAFRHFDVTERFGMAHPGPRAAEGKIWTEGEEITDRYLLQEQLALDEVEARNPMTTMWAFDEEGKQIVVLGCCLRSRDGSGHTGSVHPPGRY
jgi:hypothetical protein